MIADRFSDWLHENNCLDVCMESTGKYWVPVFNILEKRGIRVVIAKCNAVGQNSHRMSGNP